jgi:hypothetical protein
LEANSDWRDQGNVPRILAGLIAKKITHRKNQRPLLHVRNVGQAEGATPKKEKKTKYSKNKEDDHVPLSHAGGELIQGLGYRPRGRFPRPL